MTEIAPLPLPARAIIEATADQFGVTVEDIMRRRPQGGAGASGDVANIMGAKAAAISRLDNEMVGERRRYTLGQIGEWFGLSRAQVAKHRAKAADYVPRRMLRR